MHFITYITIGIISGFVIGLVGVGGGAFLIPMLIFSGMTLQQAIAVVLFTQVIPQTLPSLIQYYYKGHFLVKESILVIIGSFIGVLVGSHITLNEYIPKQVLYKIMACCLLVISIIMFFW